MSNRANPLSDSDRVTLERIAALEDQDTIERALAAARERLNMDAAYVTAIDAGTRRVTNLSGDMEALGMTPGREVPLENTYCGRMLSGAIPNIVPDTSMEPAVKGLPATARVKAYVGVPIRLADGSLHGSLLLRKHRASHRARRAGVEVHARPGGHGRSAHRAGPERATSLLRGQSHPASTEPDFPALSLQGWAVRRMVKRLSRGGRP